MSGIEINGKPLEIPHMGFTNTGSICYFNALIQCLLSSSTFLQYVIRFSKHKLFREFVESICDDKWDTIFTTRLLQYHNMVKPNQSSSEYFVFLVDLLHLEPIFEITHKLCMQCGGCGFVKFSSDKTCNMLVDNDFKEVFQFEESLDNVKCDNCKTHQRMSRRRTIEKIPPVIALSFNKYFAKRTVKYPDRFRVDEQVYELIGTIEHYGVLGAGHYVARYRRNGQEVLADDTRMRALSDLDPTENTYMVFYQRVS